MTDRLPTKIPEQLSQSEAVLYRIGEYIETFGEMEMALCFVMESLTGVRASTIQFLWHDAFVDHKIKAVRRAGIQILGPEDFRWNELKDILNSISKEIEFRNKIVHGAYQRKETGMSFGKYGKQLHDITEGLEELTPDSLYGHTSELYDMTLDLFAFASAFAMSRK